MKEIKAWECGCHGRIFSTAEEASVHEERFSRLAAAGERWAAELAKRKAHRAVALDEFVSGARLADLARKYLRTSTAMSHWIYRALKERFGGEIVRQMWREHGDLRTAAKAMMEKH